jgi:deazaflavin-dependent oxidoreductase (nitroreductase family)
MNKAITRAFMGLNVALYRMSRGKVMGRVKGMPVVLLTVPGRTTGTPHTTPVVYLEDNGRYLVAGSHLGSPIEPGWFKNLRAAESSGKGVKMELGDRQLEASVHVAGPEERPELWRKLTERASFFESSYQKKTERQIPLAVLTPR